MNDENIYSAPQANLELDEQHETVLAGRWTRFWAAILDTIIILVVFVPAMFLFGLYDRIGGQQFESSDLLLSALVLLFYALLNGYLLATSGQTIAKKCSTSGLLITIPINYCLSGKSLGSAICRYL